MVTIISHVFTNTLQTTHISAVKFTEGYDKNMSIFYTENLKSLKNINNKTKQNKTKQNKTKQNKTNKTKPKKTKQTNKNKTQKTNKNKTKKDRTGSFKVLLLFKMMLVLLRGTIIFRLLLLVVPLLFSVFVCVLVIR